jgi:hypothetical protein
MRPAFSLFLKNEAYPMKWAGEQAGALLLYCGTAAPLYPALVNSVSKPIKLIILFSLSIF